MDFGVILRKRPSPVWGKREPRSKASVKRPDRESLFRSPGDSRGLCPIKHVSRLAEGSCARMSPIIDIQQPLLCDVRINLSRRKVAVA